MNQSNFSLIPFVDRAVAQIQITGSISRQEDCLDVKYQLSGDLSKIIIPPPSQTANRQYDLWEHTCFELFLRLSNTTKYWEFNLSPTKDWNVFYFADYRHPCPAFLRQGLRMTAFRSQNLAEETAIASLPCEIWQTFESLQVSLKIDLNKIMPAKSDLDIAVATVIENQERQLSYWALTHPASKADFHHQDSFAISL